MGHSGRIDCGTATRQAESESEQEHAPAARLTPDQRTSARMGSRQSPPGTLQGSWRHGGHLNQPAMILISLGAWDWSSSWAGRPGDAAQRRTGQQRGP